MTSGLARRLHDAVWGPPGTAPSRTGLLRIVRTLLILGRDVARGQLTLRAMSLVYTTLLSIVPLLALSFSVLKAFGVSNQIQPVLLNFLAPLGAKGEDIVRRIVQFIENVNVGVLGALGLALLLYTTVSLVQKIEESLNYIWHVSRSRPLGERFSRYLSVLLVGPLLVFSALGVTATVMNLDTVRELLAVEALGDAVRIAGRLMPYLLVVAAFTFVYLFIPNTRVRLGPALIGGLIGGIAWQSAGWAFALFVATSNTYSAIYSGFAILVLFMVWLYLSWLILLFGASVAFYVQHPEYLYAVGGEPRLSNRVREQLALTLMSVIASRFAAGERAPTLPEFTSLLGVPMHSLGPLVGALESAGLVVHSGDDPPTLVPARDLDAMTVAEILHVVRTAGEERYVSPATLAIPEPVDAVLGRVQAATASAVQGMTLRELATGARSASEPDAPEDDGFSALR